MADLAANVNLLFGLLALQNGLVDQVQLVAGFRAWTRNKSRTLADHLVARGDLDEMQRGVVAALVDLHIQKHGGSTAESLAAISADRSTHESLTQLGDADVDATLAFVGSGSAQTRSDLGHDASTRSPVGTATTDGQRFRVVRPHAQGGLGAVFVALDAELDREVALKQILDDQADDPVSRGRFVQEAMVTGGLEHPGIVPVYGLGHHADGRPYYAMRFIRGESLKEAISAFHSHEALKSDPGRRSLELRKLLQQFVDVCNAIEYAHSRGVLHRDIKPSNIIVGRYGETLMVDWGMAKAMGRVDSGSASGERMLIPSSGIRPVETIPGSALGTPAYMSPEQAEGDLQSLGPRSDVYSLGATLYCILTGQAAFDGDIGAVIHAVRQGDFRPPRQLVPEIDPAMQAICMKAMAHARADRYATPRALAEDIERWMADQPISGWREPLSRRARRWARRHRTAVAAAAAAILAGVIGLAAVLAVQARLNSDLRAKNRQLATASMRIAEANAGLAEANRQVQARFDLAMEAIRTFHTGVSEDVLLKQKELEELRTKLLRSAREFYRKLESQLRGQTDWRALEALGGAYDEIGRLSDKIGSKEEGLEDLERRPGLRGGWPATTRDPARADLGRTLRAIGGLLAQSGRHAEAIESYAQARAIFAELAREGPETEIGRDLARCDRDIGYTYYLSGKPAEALSALERAKAAIEALPAAERSTLENQAELARTLSSICLVLRQTGRTSEVITTYRRLIEILEGVIRSQPTTEFLADLATYEVNLGQVYRQLGRRSEALEIYRSAASTRERIAKEYPSITSFQVQLANVYNSLGNVLEELNRPEESIPAMERAAEIYEPLVKANPAATQVATNQATILRNLGLFQVQAGRIDAARTSYERSLAICLRLVKDHSTVPQFQSNYAFAASGLADLRASSGDRAGALQLLREASRIFEGIASPWPNDLFQFARVHARIGLLLDQAPGERRPEPSDAPQAHFDAAVGLIRRSIAGGYPDYRELKGLMDLDPLRSRPDFRLLMMDQVFPAEPFAPRD